MRSERDIDSGSRSRLSRLRTWLIVGVLAYVVLLGDHTIGHLYFKKVCADEAGTKIHRVVPKVEGFWWWPIKDSRFATQYGYNFVEGGVYRDKARRFAVVGSKIETSNDVSSISRYIVYDKQVEMRGGMFVRTEELIQDTVTGEQLASAVSFSFRSGWLLRTTFSSAFSTVVARCPKERIDIERMITTTLKPINSKE